MTAACAFSFFIKENPLHPQLQRGEHVGVDIVAYMDDLMRV